MKKIRTEKEYQDLQKTNWNNCIHLGEEIEKRDKQIEKLKAENEKLKSKNYYHLPKFDKHKRCNCTVCRYMRGIRKVLSKTDYEKYWKLLETIEGDYELAHLEELGELDIQNFELKSQITSLKSQLADTEKRLDIELNMNFEKYDNQIAKLLTENKDLKSQLANIKYLNAVKVEDIFYSMIKPHFIDNKFDDDNSLVSREKFEEAIQAICKLAIPDIDRDKIIEVLDSRFKTQLRMYLIELYSVTGKLTEKQENDIKDYMKKSADEIIKAIRGGE